MSQNLSEELFKPKYDYRETTSLINRLDLDELKSFSVLDGYSDPSWYRAIHPVLWHWRGASIIEIEDVLSRIAASKKSPDDKRWFDSVSGFQSGNWIYEFLAQANKWQQRAEEVENNTQITEEQRNTELHQCWSNVSIFSSLASYPHYKMDDLASQAQTLAYRAYKKAIKFTSCGFKTIDFKVKNHTIQGFLHLPEKETSQPYPTLIMCGSLIDLQTDFYHYFINYLKPNGVALLTIDNPGIANSRQISLTPDTTIIHKAVLEQSAELPWVDQTKIILAGFRFGAGIATRLAYLAPHLVKGVLNFGPIVHHLFTDKSLQSSLPIMYQDMFATRMGLNNVSAPQLSSELVSFSLKIQGIINKPCPVPVMNVIFDDDKLSTLQEAKLISSVKQSQIIRIESTQLKQSYEKALKQSTDWLVSLIKD